MSDLFQSWQCHRLVQQFLLACRCTVWRSQYRAKAHVNTSADVRNDARLAIRRAISSWMAGTFDVRSSVMIGKPPQRRMISSAAAVPSSSPCDELSSLSQTQRERERDRAVRFKERFVSANAVCKLTVTEGVLSKSTSCNTAPCAMILPSFSSTSEQCGT